MGPVTLIADRESKETHHNISYATTRTSPETRDQAAQTIVPYEASRAEQLERTAQALAVTVQYMTCEVRLLPHSCSSSGCHVREPRR